jgi:ABC-type hemin transport system substrate-binding protein
MMEMEKGIVPTNLVRHRSELPARPFQRIVSLVPSLSEALVVLGLGDRLVGVTAYCVEPPGAFEGLARIGGTKDADVEAILALAPDLVIANQEENTARVVGRLAERGVAVWVTYPRSVRAGAELLCELAELGASPEARARVVDPVLAALEAAESARTAAERAGRRRPRVFCAIWRDPWMTVGADTYIHDLIELCGGENAFANGARGTGGPDDAGGGAGGESARRDGNRSGSERRYPIVGLSDIERAAPEVILLPSEPYAFGEVDRGELAGLDCPAAVHDRIHLIDGTLVSWYGPRIAEAIRVLGRLLAIS